ncbi:hypothetical protein [Sphingobium algorifonticola]|uniref:Flagellar FliJ protein n=1 Tax=Sphingobium algorifonticola TaxID=2008318 RepID=A0A437JBS7_9SPHN|nr:hypothetical protein [Sphingobium algorifonticola]RVT43335.1 hypothetical protein ENE74_01490 [Sphingobium algorifonticola]
MKGLLARRHRVLRARHVQHALAVADTVRAQDEANAIANNAQRLSQVRKQLFQTDSMSSGAAFGAYRELADRLEQAGRQLDGALYDANLRLEEKQGRRIEANREKEIAARLKDQTRTLMAERQEARIAALPRYRRIQKAEG